MDEELRPNIDKWVKDPKGYPLSLHKRAYELGIQVHFIRISKFLELESPIYFTVVDFWCSYRV